MQINHKHFDSITSTNDYLLMLAKTADYNYKIPHVCTTNYQTNGKGQHGKIWYSPPNCNLYFSYLYSSKKSVNNLGDLTLTAANIVLKILQEFNINKNITIKHPNDIMWNNKKLAGILIETNYNQYHNITNVVTGIGLNVNLNKASKEQIDQPWVSMQQISGTQQDIHTITELLILELNSLIFP